MANRIQMDYEDILCQIIPADYEYSLKIENVIKELIQLRAIADKLKAPLDLNVYYTQLLMVNQDLWDIEDKKRKHEKEQIFDDAFIQLARQVYLKNDIRAKIKRDINVLLGSSIIEEKSY